MTDGPAGNLTPLSVVVPTSGRRERLPAFLAPILDDREVDEVVVVVDGADDGSIEWLRERASIEPKLVPVLRERPGGAQVARADGLERAASDVVLFLDDDVVASGGLAGGHLAHHAHRPGLVVVGYMPVALPRRRSPGQFASYLYAEEYESRCAAYERDPGEILRTLWWGNVSIRRSDADRVGLVSPGLEAAYHEDQDFGLRCRAAGLEGVFDRSLRADHHHGRDPDGFVRDALSQGVGRVLVHQRHPGVMGVLTVGDFEAGVPGALRWVVKLGGHPAAGRAATAVLRALVLAVGRLRLFALETNVGRLLRRLCQRRGAELAWSDRLPDPDHRNPSRKPTSTRGRP